jgi:Cu-Zn family superoxide dismutase
MRTLLAMLLLMGIPIFYLAANAADDKKDDEELKAVVVLHPTEGSKTHGTITFTQKGGVVTVKGKVMGLKPGLHAFHIHEFGDCSSHDGMATGGHFNPTKQMHGARDAEVRHVGDLGNIKADDEGMAVIDFTDKVISLSGKNSIIGRGAIVHAAADDFKTQPTGNAGARVASGVVGWANPKPPAPK